MPFGLNYGPWIAFMPHGDQVQAPLGVRTSFYVCAPPPKRAHPGLFEDP